MMKLERQSKKTLETTLSGEGAQLEVERLAELWAVNNATLAVPGTLQLEAKLTFQVTEPAMEEYGFVKDTSFSEMKHLYEPETGSNLHKRVEPVRADPSYSNQAAHGQPSSAQDL